MRKFTTAVIFFSVLSMFAQDNVLLDSNRANSALLSIYRTNRPVREEFLLGIEAQIATNNASIFDSFDILAGLMQDLAMKSPYQSKERAIIYRYMDKFYSQTPVETQDRIRILAIRCLELEFADFDQMAMSNLILLLGTVGDKIDENGLTLFETSRALTRIFNSEILSINVINTGYIAESLIISTARLLSKDTKGIYLNTVYFTELKSIANNRAWGWRISLRLDNELKKYIMSIR